MNIYDIAKITGLSIATVSRVVNKKDNVSPKTKDKVNSVITKYGYTPNSMAIGLATKYSRTVAVLVPDSERFFSVAISTIYKKLEEYGYDVLLYCTGNNAEHIENYFNRALAKNVDGVIFVGSLFNIDELIKEKQTPPIISINGRESDLYYTVRCDECTAVKNAVKTAYKEGKRSFLFLYNFYTYSAQQKINGFLQAMAELGIDENCYRIKMIDNHNSFDVELENDGIWEDIVFCSGDNLAIALVNTLPKGKTSIVGFDNSTLCNIVTTPISSIDNNLELMCVTAINILRDLLNNKEAPKTTEVPSELVRRSSF